MKKKLLIIIGFISLLMALDVQAKIVEKEFVVGEITDVKLNEFIDDVIIPIAQQAGFDSKYDMISITSIRIWDDEKGIYLPGVDVYMHNGWTTLTTNGHPKTEYIILKDKYEIQYYDRWDSTFVKSTPLKKKVVRHECDDDDIVCRLTINDDIVQWILYKDNGEWHVSKIYSYYLSDWIKTDPVYWSLCPSDQRLQLFNRKIPDSVYNYIPLTPPPHDQMKIPTTQSSQSNKKKK